MKMKDFQAMDVCYRRLRAMNNQQRAPIHFSFWTRTPKTLTFAQPSYLFQHTLCMLWNLRDVHTEHQCYSTPGFDNALVWVIPKRCQHSCLFDTSFSDIWLCETTEHITACDDIAIFLIWTCSPTANFLNPPRFLCPFLTALFRFVFFLKQSKDAFTRAMYCQHAFCFFTLIRNCPRFPLSIWSASLAVLGFTSGWHHCRSIQLLTITKNPDMIRNKIRPSSFVFQSKST